MGIPGLLIYLVFLFRCWKVLTAVIRRKTISAELRVMAGTLRAAFVVVATVAAFDSLTYNTNIPILHRRNPAFSHKRDQLWRVCSLHVARTRLRTRLEWSSLVICVESRESSSRTEALRKSNGSAE